LKAPIVLPIKGQRDFTGAQIFQRTVSPPNAQTIAPEALKRVYPNRYKTKMNG